jgi:hypothetical protein
MNTALFARLQDVRPHPKPRKRLLPDSVRYPHGDLFGPCPTVWTPRKGNFATSEREKMASQCRGVLIERLDSILTERCDVWEAEFAELPPDLVQRLLVKFIQDVQINLFPQEFLDDSDTAEMIRSESVQKGGLIPPEGTIERVGWDRFAAYAESLGVEYEEPEPPGPTCTIGGVSFPAKEADVLRSRGR